LITASIFFIGFPSPGLQRRGADFGRAQG